MTEESKNLEAWLEAFPREEVERNIRQLESDLSRWRNALAIHDSLAAPEAPAESGEETPSKPAAIALILKETGRPLTSKQIRSEMIKRGWLPDSPKATKRFYSTMSRLKSEERIRHLQNGTYVLPEPKEESLTLS